MFTIILISLGAAFLVATVVNEIRNRRRPGHYISQSAVSDDDQVNQVQLIQEPRIHRPGRGDIPS